MEISFDPFLAGGAAVRWPETARIAGAAGYDAVDLWLRDVGGAQEAREVLAAAGVAAGPAAQLPVEFRRDEATFEAALRDLPRLATLAAELGVTTLYRSVPASSDTRADELVPVLLRRLARVVPILEDRGLALAIEVLGPLHRRREGRHELLWRLRDAAGLADRLGGATGVLADAWHWHNANETADDLAALGVPILHVHVADAPSLAPEAIHDLERLLPGEGVVDFAAFFAGLAAAGYGGAVTPEIPGYRCAGDPVACARRALDATRSVLPTAR